ncbi:MAG: type V CRISPR-associated protein Cas12a/Cpf1 [Spirochaetia bacterium]|nr:type V CRISPR-associated protein Cas12a/Cpf1 [Spirochaetia bacterium]
MIKSEQDKQKSIWDEFTNLYSLSKTLRFELKPVGADGKRLSPEKASDLLGKIIEQDKKIKTAYTALKPVMDRIHESIINGSLTADAAKKIEYTDYFKEYLKGKEKSLDELENSLRKQIGATFETTANAFAEKANIQNEELEKLRSNSNDRQRKKTEKDEETSKPILKSKNSKPAGIEYLTQAGILKYIENNISDLVSAEQVPEFINKKELIDAKGKKSTETSGYLADFKGFFTYFSGYNQNRENYYESDKEASTAVATRIVHENLPKFCDNIIQFSIGKTYKTRNSSGVAEVTISRKEEYLNALDYLKNNGRTTQIKDAETNKYIEALPISEDWFTIHKFSECLSQFGIEKHNKVIGHYNLLINLYNQARKNEPEFRKLPPFKTLYKQIGCGKKKTLFTELKYDTEAQQRDANDKSEDVLNLEGTLKLISDAGVRYFTKDSDSKDRVTVHTFLEWLEQNDGWTGIYWSKAAIDKISNRYLANWHEIKDRIQETLEGTNKELKEKLKSVASYDKKREEQLKINDAVELSGLFEILNQSGEIRLKDFFKESVFEESSAIIDENISPAENLINLICADIEGFALKFLEQSPSILAISDYKNENNILTIKEWLDTAKSLLWLIKDFEVRESKVKGNQVNPELANMLVALLHSSDADWFGWYDLVRNYLTKKPQDDVKKNKLKLNFENGSLLNGFVDSFSDSDNATQYGGYIFRKSKSSSDNINYDYYLGISKNSKLFRCHLQNKIKGNDKSNFERLEYYQAKSTTYFDDNYSANKASLIEKIEMLISKITKGKPDLAEEAKKIIKKNKYGEITPTSLLDKIQKSKNKEFQSILTDQPLIAILSKSIEELKLNTENFISRAPQLQDIINTDYNGIDGLKRIIGDFQKIARENKIYNYFAVSKAEFNAAIQDTEKPLYLFKINNKDLNNNETHQRKINHKGIENLHTLYFRALMREAGSIGTIDLGKGELFLREKAIENKVIHYANQPIFRRSDGKTESRFSHDIIKDKRFTEEKFLLHLSATLNFNPTKKNVTEKVNDHFSESPDIRFLGIDRGEKHLIYYSLVDFNGKIIEQNHLDVINKKDYLQAITEAAKTRKEKQLNWQQKGNISNLKDGYISLVVHEIMQRLKDKDDLKPTFIVLEDLNTGFKRSRQKFEQQVYQKFELALAKKLNYLVYKNAPSGEIGSVEKALQLTPPVTNYQDIENRKQIGIMLYTRANYTSVTDPVTGWRKSIYLKKGSEESIREQIFSVFDEIACNSEGDYYLQYTDKNSGREITLWSGNGGKALERYRSVRGKDKNEYHIESYNIKEILDTIFKDYDKNESILQQMKDQKELKKVDKEKNSWESLRFVIDLIQQIRNSGDPEKGQKDNFLLSPVRDINGNHFDSRIYENVENPSLPKDADANGAYNIARKGIIMYEHIKQWVKDGKTEKDLNLYVSDSEWDLWVSDRKKWQAELKYLASKKAKESYGESRLQLPKQTGKTMLNKKRS